MGRHKPNKPHRDRSEPTRHDHTFPVPDNPEQPEGLTCDYALMGQLVGAAFDHCQSCQGIHLALVAEDPGSVARLVELACIVIKDSVGALPDSLWRANTPGIASDAFRTLVRAGVEGGNSQSLWQRSEALTPAERTEAVNTALDLLIGHLISLATP